MSDPKWDWADSFTGAVMGAIAGLASAFGWVNKRLGTVHGRINETNQRVADQATEIAVLSAHHEANLQFQERVDASLRALTTKNDEQLRILSRLEGKVTHNQGGQ